MCIPYRGLIQASTNCCQTRGKGGGGSDRFPFAISTRTVYYDVLILRRKKCRATSTAADFSRLASRRDIIVGGRGRSLDPSSLSVRSVRFYCDVSIRQTPRNLDLLATGRYQDLKRHMRGCHQFWAAVKRPHYDFFPLHDFARATRWRNACRADVKNDFVIIIHGSIGSAALVSSSSSSFLINTRRQVRHTRQRPPRSGPPHRKSTSVRLCMRM